jgi:hypothetical protein
MSKSTKHKKADVFINESEMDKYAITNNSESSDSSCSESNSDSSSSNDSVILYSNSETADNFYNKIEEIRRLDENKQIIIQTDTSQFVDYINNKNLKNIIFFNENRTSYSNRGIHNEKTSDENYKDMLNIFSIFLILSKCKYIICGSGNCSIWIMFYRGNSQNVYQFLNGNWFTPTN